MVLQRNRKRKTATTQCKVRSVDTILDRCIKTMAKAKAERIKLVMVGDEAVGKSCLLTGYTDNIFSSKYEPTVFVTHTAYIKNEEGDQVEIAVFDTAGTNLFSLVLIILIHNISVFVYNTGC